MNKEKDIVIGTVNLNYQENGKLETAGFYPKIKISHDEILGQLGDCSNKSLDEVKQCAQLLLASFFAKVSDIELRDIEKTEIEAVLIHNDNFENGGLKDIEFEFIYKQK